jgi:ketosteroid isomerase-like protein
MSEIKAEMSRSDVEATRQRTLDLAGMYQTLLGQGRFDEWIALWHDDAILEFPYVPAGRTSSYRGKEAILAYMKAASGRIATDAVDELRVHEAADPHMLVVELATRGHLVGSGAPYDQRYVCVFELREGLLWRYREYWNPLVSIDAHGGLDEWLASYPAANVS